MDDFFTSYDRNSDVQKMFGFFINIATQPSFIVTRSLQVTIPSSTPSISFEFDIKVTRVASKEKDLAAWKFPMKRESQESSLTSYAGVVKRSASKAPQNHPRRPLRKSDTQKKTSPPVVSSLVSSKSPASKVDKKNEVSDRNTAPDMIATAPSLPLTSPSSSLLPDLSISPGEGSNSRLEGGAHFPPKSSYKNPSINSVSVDDVAKTNFVDPVVSQPPLEPNCSSSSSESIPSPSSSSSAPFPPQIPPSSSPVGCDVILSELTPESPSSSSPSLSPPSTPPPSSHTSSPISSPLNDDTPSPNWKHKQATPLSNCCNGDETGSEPDDLHVTIHHSSTGSPEKFLALLASANIQPRNFSVRKGAFSFDVPMQSAKSLASLEGIKIDGNPLIFKRGGLMCKVASYSPRVTPPSGASEQK